jgi:DNA-binding IclR family transcriptional regulator
LPNGADELGDELRLVLEAVAGGHETVAALTAHGINGSTALTGLATLELRGFLERRADGSYRLSR